jgi:hypothetical protein
VKTARLIKREVEVELQQRDTTSQLADAQHAVAREYGFASWPKLKAYVERGPTKTTNPFARSVIA